MHVFKTLNQRIDEELDKRQFIDKSITDTAALHKNNKQQMVNMYKGRKGEKTRETAKKRRSVLTTSNLTRL